MQTPLSDYEQKVFNLIDKIEIGSLLEVAKWSKEETRNDFISAIKKRIDLFRDCEFNSNYSKFRKTGTFKQQIANFKEV